MRTFLLCLVFGFLVSAANAQKQPNFLIIAIDDLNDYVGSLKGHPNASTPNLDRLAKQGVLFTNAHCNSPVCNSSRASLWTGLRPTTTGIVSNRSGWFLDRPVFEDIVTLSQAVINDGYQSIGYGKLYHLGSQNKTEGEWQRFNRYNYGPKIEHKLNSEGRGDRLTDWGVPPPGEEPSDDEAIANLTISVLEDTLNSPFFLCCGFFRPHTPLYAAQHWFDAHPLSTIQLPPGAVKGDRDDLVYFGARERRPQDVEAPGLWDQDWVESTGNWENILRAYLASTSAMDHELGRVMDALESSTYSDNTYIICFSDHGWHLGEKEHWGKAALWEQTTRVPFIVVGPGIPQGKICDRPTELLDIYPTVMDYAGLEPPHKLQGQSIRPLLENVDAEWNHPALTTFVDHHAIRTDRWRYIRYASGEEELYDMENDPHEFSNLAVTDPHSQLVRNTLETHRSKLQELLKPHKL